MPSDSSLAPSNAQAPELGGETMSFVATRSKVQPRSCLSDSGRLRSERRPGLSALGSVENNQHIRAASSRRYGC